MSLLRRLVLGLELGENPKNLNSLEFDKNFSSQSQGTRYLRMVGRFVGIVESFIGVYKPAHES